MEEERVRLEAEHRLELNAEAEHAGGAKKRWKRRFDEELAARMQEVQATAAAARQKLQQELEERLAAEVRRLDEAHRLKLTRAGTDGGSGARPSPAGAHRRIRATADRVLRRP